VTVLEKIGDTRLGGNDFDQFIFDHFLGQMQQNEGWNDSFLTDKAFRCLVRAKSEYAKKYLTQNLSCLTNFEYTFLDRLVNNKK
jgi:molecular chaperone DnaK (HSP70)